MKASELRDLTNNTELLEVARRAIEDVLVDFRDSRMSVNRNNGCCIKEKDGTPSSIIRLTHEHALSIALNAIADKLAEQEEVEKKKGRPLAIGDPVRILPPDPYGDPHAWEGAVGIISSLASNEARYDLQVTFPDTTYAPIHFKRNEVERID